jgi:hypothetical protein
VPEDKLGHEHLVVLVEHDWDPLPIVGDLDAALLLVDDHSKDVHGLVSLVVVCRIDQHLVEYFVEGRDVLPLGLGEDAFGGGEPEVGLGAFGAADVGVRPQEDVL